MPFTSPVFDAIACGMLLASMNYESFIIRRAKMQPSHFVAKAPTAKNNVFVANTETRQIHEVKSGIATIRHKKRCKINLCHFPRGHGFS